MCLATPSSQSSSEQGFGLLGFGLYVTIVILWGTSWFPLKLQIGVVAPHVSLTWRFLIAAIIMMALVGVTRRPLRFPLRMHLRFLLLGIFLFSTNFALFYYGAQWIASGLLSVVFSLASIVNIGFALIIYGQIPTRRVLFGALLGVTGIAALFWPEIMAADADPGTFLGLLFCLAGTVSFCIGNLVSAQLQRSGISVMSGNAWGMVYGAAFSALIALISGAAFIIEPTASYVISLLWLSVPGTVLAFWCYLTLLGRIGSARAGYATILFPIVALLVSTLVENYQWTLLGITGAALALAGNGLVLSGRKKRVRTV